MTKRQRKIKKLKNKDEVLREIISICQANVSCYEDAKKTEYGPSDISFAKFRLSKKILEIIKKDQSFDERMKERYGV
jgi:hypothetical protein